MVPPIKIRPFAKLYAPVLEWAQECGDGWLREEISRRLRFASEGELWAVAVVVGMFMRLLRQSHEVERALVKDLLDGRVTDPTVPARRWASGLTQVQRENILDLTLAEADKLCLLAEDVAEDAAGSPFLEPYQLEDLRRFFLLRDDLESVSLVLRGTDEGDTLQGSLESADDTCKEIVSSRNLVPPQLEQLHRAGEVDLDCWWAAD